MRVLIVLLIILVFFVWGAVEAQQFLEKSAEDISAELNRLIKAIEDERWEEATDLYSLSTAKWRAAESKWGLLAEHREMDTISESFNRAGAFIATRDKGAALAETRNAIELVKHIPEKEAFTLSNIF